MFDWLRRRLLADRHGTPAIVLRLLRTDAYAHRWSYALAFVFMGAAAASTAGCAYLLGSSVNQAYVDRSLRGVVLLSIATIVLFVIKGLATYAQTVILSRISNSIVADNQRRMFDKLLTESLGYFAPFHSSEFIARLGAGVAAVSQVLALLINGVGRDLLALVALVGVMVFQEPLLSFIGLVVAPPILFGMRKIVRRIHQIALTQFAGGTKIIETMQETLQGLRVVKAFTLEEDMRNRFFASVADIERAANKMARVSNRASPLMEALGGFAIALVLIYAGYRVIESGAAPGQFFSFITAFIMAYEPAKRLVRLNVDLQRQMVGVRVLFEVLDSPPSEPADHHRPALVMSAARVEFANVDFAYRANEPVIRAMSFVALPGQTTALVGPSGGGKSTVISLLLRFYEPSGGKIVIDGQDIVSFSRRSLRRQVGYVGQNVHLFRGTIRENIAFGRPGATQADIIAAARGAHAHEFIKEFPLGYDTPVGEHGMQLSGGQRQRVSIARALIKDAPLILLDEATAALDSESERYVQNALAELTKGRTTIVIAHRLSTIMHADSILVVEAGAIVEQGRHSELLRQGGRYATFYRLQLQEQDRPGHASTSALIVAPAAE
ncbi:MAG: ABC transporter ATP-binding protein [Proteobacteria bacterium]|nr:ABC transporter ATP-binding protein [Pseudomonadota bacterium]